MHLYCDQWQNTQFSLNILSSEPPTPKECQRYLRTSHETRINKYFDHDLLPKSGSFYMCIESPCSNGLHGIQIYTPRATRVSNMNILLDFSLTVKAVPHECVIRASQP